jgi:uncharacterized protein
MLELRPTCENCNKELNPHSLEAMICSFECTFCRTCVETVLENVCPNCGGGFSPRPIRPATNWKDNNFLGAYPATAKARHRPVDQKVHQKFAERLRLIDPDKR